MPSKPTTNHNNKKTNGKNKDKTIFYVAFTYPSRLKKIETDTTLKVKHTQAYTSPLSYAENASHHTLQHPKCQPPYRR